MRIEIQTISHESQAYETVGNYGGRFPSNFWIKVSYMKDWRKCFLVIIHEMIEFAICHHRGIKNKDITAFDKRFEAERKKGLHGLDDEPGDSVYSPYRSCHFFATSIERLIASELGVNWIKYSNAINNLPTLSKAKIPNSISDKKRKG